MFFLLRWLSWWAGIGITIPIVVAFLYGFAGIFFDRTTVLIWPTSLYLMALDTAVPPSRIQIALVWALAALPNLSIYTCLGLVLFMPAYAVARMRAA